MGCVKLCMCLTPIRVGGVVCEWVRGLGLGLRNPVGIGGVWDMFGLRWCGGWTGSVSGRVEWCYVCVCCEFVFFV